MIFATIKEHFHRFDLSKNSKSLDTTDEKQTEILRDSPEEMKSLSKGIEISRGIRTSTTFIGDRNPNVVLERRSFSVLAPKRIMPVEKLEDSYPTFPTTVESREVLSLSKSEFSAQVENNLASNFTTLQTEWSEEPLSSAELYSSLSSDVSILEHLPVNKTYFSTSRRVKDNLENTHTVTIDIFDKEDGQQTIRTIIRPISRTRAVLTSLSKPFSHHLPAGPSSCGKPRSRSNSNFKARTAGIIEVCYRLDCIHGKAAFNFEEEVDEMQRQREWQLESGNAYFKVHTGGTQVAQKNKRGFA